MSAVRIVESSAASVGSSMRPSLCQGLGLPIAASSAGVSVDVRAPRLALIRGVAEVGIAVHEVRLDLAQSLWPDDPLSGSEDAGLAQVRLYRVAQR